MGVREKTIGFIIDELITVSQKLWHLQDDMLLSEDPVVSSNAAKKVQQLNVRRNELINAIDEWAGEGSNPMTIKTYAKHFNK